MTWREVGATVAGVAPVLGTVLGGPAGGAIGAVVASLFGVKAEPDAVAAAIKADPAAAAKLIDLQQTHERELLRLHLEAETKALAEVNATIRAEVASEDRFVRRMRPSFGYSVMWQCNALVLGLMAAAFVKPDALGLLGTIIPSITSVLMIEVGVLGLYVVKRSDVDKRLAAGVPPAPPLLDLLKARVAPRPAAAAAPESVLGNLHSGGQ